MNRHQRRALAAQGGLRITLPDMALGQRPRVVRTDIHGHEVQGAITPMDHEQIVHVAAIMANTTTHPDTPNFRAEWGYQLDWQAQAREDGNADADSLGTETLLDILDACAVFQDRAREVIERSRRAKAAEDARRKLAGGGAL